MEVFIILSMVLLSAYFGAYAKDFIQGDVSDDSKIFEHERVKPGSTIMSIASIYSPRPEVEALIFTAPDKKIIKGIRVTDLLPDKNNEVVLIDGGIGEEYVVLGFPKALEFEYLVDIFD